MKTILFGLTLLVLILAVNGQKWSACGKDPALQVKSITFSNTERGKPFTINVNGILKRPVTGGTAKMTVKYGNYEAFKKQEPVCVTKSTCPIPAGPITKSYSYVIPQNAPSGLYTANFAVSDGNNEIACINYEISLK